MKTPIFIQSDLLEKQILYNTISPLNAKLNPIFHLLALLGSHHILDVSRIRVKLQCIPHHVLHSSSGLSLRRKFLVTESLLVAVSQSYASSFTSSSSLK